MSTSAISNTFLQAGLKLPHIYFNVIDFVIMPDSGNGYGDSMDLILDPDWLLPFAVDKKGFVTQDSNKIRVGDNHTAFKTLAPLHGNAELKKIMMIDGCYLKLLSFNGSDPQNVPNHAIEFGQCPPLVYPNFPELLNMPEKSALQGGANEFAQPTLRDATGDQTTAPQTLTVRAVAVPTAATEALDRF